MDKMAFGRNDQVILDSPEDYFELLGYLARNDGLTEVVWENNDEQGAWAPEGRIHFSEKPPSALKAHLHHTAGRGSVVSRVNCNAFVDRLLAQHAFVEGGQQNEKAIRATVPAQYHKDFDRGLAL